jgi:hypothetical protein
MLSGVASGAAEHSRRNAVVEDHVKAPQMLAPSPDRRPGLVSGLLQSYAGDLKGWTTRIVVRYAMAVALLLAAAAGLIGATSVGLAALFHWIESTYGLNTAYAAVAGLLMFLALVSAGVAVLLLTGKLPPLPRPKRQQTRAAGQSLAARAVLATTSNKGLLKTDPATEIMIGLAAACLVGWLVTSRLGRAGGRAGVK